MPLVIKEVKKIKNAAEISEKQHFQYNKSIDTLQSQLDHVTWLLQLKEEKEVSLGLKIKELSQNWDGVNELLTASQNHLESRDVEIWRLRRLIDQKDDMIAKLSAELSTYSRSQVEHNH